MQALIACNFPTVSDGRGYDQSDADLLQLKHIDSLANTFKMSMTSLKESTITFEKCWMCTNLTRRFYKPLTITNQY